jgi:hypothetical protein
LPLDVSCYLQKGKLCLILVDRFVGLMQGSPTLCDF